MTRDEILPKIASAACAVCGITLEQMRSDSRKREYCTARQLFSFIAVRDYKTLFTYQNIADFIYSDHQMVLHHSKKAACYMENEKPFQELHAAVMSRIQPELNIQAEHVAETVEFLDKQIASLEFWLQEHPTHPMRLLIIQDVRTYRNRRDLITNVSLTVLS